MRADPTLAPADRGLRTTGHQQQHMETPEALRTADRQGVTVREYEYENESVIAVDFGVATNELSVDIVGDTAIAVADGQQIEFEIPPGAKEVTTNDGILTIEG
jgi:hypothetical protein